MKKVLFWLLLSAFVMLALPFFAVTFAKSDAGMAICFLLFFAVDPIYSLVVGAFAGRNIRKLWFLPLFPPVFFLAGVWAFFSLGETAFFLYAAIYLAIGAVAALICALVNKK